MSLFITQDKLKLIKKFSLPLILSLIWTLILGCALGCTDDARSRLEKFEVGTIELPSGKKLKVYVAQSISQQKRGLSGLTPKQFLDNESMLFPGNKNQIRQFWMPETHFDLDIFFLNKDLYVLDVHRSLTHFPHAEPKEKIPLSKAVYSRHVLEVKSSSPLAKEIQPGMLLKWTGDSRLLQIK